MQSAFLALESPTQPPHEIALTGEVVLGRALDCELIIDDPAASRRHARIFPHEAGFRWEDLESTNGTRCNGVVKGSGELHDGDELRIGDAVIRFRMEAAKDSELFKRSILVPEASVAAGPPPEHTEDLLRAVCTVMGDIASDDEPCVLVDRILGTLLDAVDAQRAAIFFAGAEGGELQPCPDCGAVHMIDGGKLRAAKAGEIRVSETVANRVLRDGESVLYQDTAGDQELSAAESVLALDLHSIICVPLRGKDSVFGVLYLDSDTPDRKYGEEDLLLSAALGNGMGLALENARMRRELLEKQRMDQEIQHAWSIQQGFLVKSWPEDDPRFAVYGETRPAKVVGGDFYDFVQPAPNRIGVLIGDVSGKGVPAALTMAQVLTEFRLRAQHAECPSEVLRALNANLVEHSQMGSFCTLCYITIDLDSGHAVCANAGHPPSVHVSGDMARTCGGASGPPLGVVLESAWSDESHQLQPGDGLLLYTDGVTEARAYRDDSAIGEVLEFGEERLVEAAKQATRTGPQALIEAVNREVQRFCAPEPPHDDCTMIAVRYMG